MDQPVNESSLPGPEILDEIDAHMYKIAIFRAALQLQVWAKVAAGEDTPERIAASQHWDLRGARMLLDDLCAMRLLAKEESQYRLVPEADRYLLPEKPTYMGRYLLADFGWEGNGQLADAIRTGKRPIGYSATASEAVDTWIGVYSQSWAAPETYLGRCDEIWREVGIEAHDGLRVLDVACGPAPRSLSLAHAHRGVHVTLLDWEGVLAKANNVASGLGIEDQVESLTGDMWSTPFGVEQFHVVYLGNITHFLSPDENTRLFRKAYGALGEGGAVVVNAVRREHPSPMAPALWFYATSRGGAPYDFAEYKSMLQLAGFVDVVEAGSQPIKATKGPHSAHEIGGGATR
jgi:SAM-dependent methyltransferase